MITSGHSLQCVFGWAERMKDETLLVPLLWNGKPPLLAMAVECMNITNNVGILRTLVDSYPAQVTLLGLQFQWTADQRWPCVMARQVWP